MKKGLTLIELVLVLVILSVLTHLAVSQIDNSAGERKAKAADVLLDAIADAAVQGDDSFFADTGMLPRARPSEASRQGAPLDLRDLWERPVDIAPYAVRRATSSNLVPGLPAELADPSVMIPCGWRGPYINPGRSGTLRDPWGNPMQTPDEAAYPRILNASTNAVGSGEEVKIVRHLGSDGQPDDLHAPEKDHQRDRLISFEDAASPSRIFISTSFVDEYGVESSRNGMTVTVKWYQPCGGMITGGVARAVEPAPAVIEGARGKFFYYSVSTSAETGMVKRVAIRPGDNFVCEKLRTR